VRELKDRLVLRKSSTRQGLREWSATETEQAKRQI